MTTEPVYNLITKVKKRNGAIQEFQQDKIVIAIYKALEATGKPDAYKTAEKLKDKVVKNLQKSGYGGEKLPTVEGVQDIVESVLLESDYADTAKAYILYRHERRMLRDEKMKILQTDDLDEVDKTFPTNSLRVLEARYLLRDGDGNLNEKPKQLFERVAVLVALSDVLHDPRIYEREHPEPHGHEELYPPNIAEAEDYLAKSSQFGATFKIGKYHINQYHFEQFTNFYIRLAQEGEMKIGFKELLKMLASGELNGYEKNIEEYYNMMISRDFLPNTPTLMNAGARLGQLSACFVLGMEDSLDKIMKSATDSAMIFKSGGGVGINYSDLRPAKDLVASTSGVASGPTSFMNIVNVVTDVVKQGGKRRGANMAILEAWHPDIEEFITMKTRPGVMENFNVSVGIKEDFWQALVNNEKFPLHSPNNGNARKYVNAQQMIEMIAISAWKSAEPGVIFLDNGNKHNPAIPLKGQLRCTNPCGEQFLYPYESCNLGSINLANFVKRNADGNYEFDWARYEQSIRTTTRFLDNIVDMNKYPIPEIDKESRDTRRIGLGIMGLADALFLLRLPYNSQEGYEMMNKLAEALTYYSMHESVRIAMSRGAFPYFAQTDYVKGVIPVAGYYDLPRNMRNYDWDDLIEGIKQHGIRNSWNTTIAPTGTLSMIADCSNGVEPSFALVFAKHVTVGKFDYANKIFEMALKQRGLYSDEMLTKIKNNYGSVRGLKEIPDEIQNLFVTAMDIHWTDHVMAQAIWQRWISNAIAKTINMPGDVTAEDVKCAYLLSHELGLKGVTVYRDGSRESQVLHITGENDGTKKFEVSPSPYVTDYVKHNVKEPYVAELLYAILFEAQKPPQEQVIMNPKQETQKAHTEPVYRKLEDNGKVCPTCHATLIIQAGCSSCIECGYSGCGSG